MTPRWSVGTYQVMRVSCRHKEPFQVRCNAYQYKAEIGSLQRGCHYFTRVGLPVTHDTQSLNERQDGMIHFKRLVTALFRKTTNPAAPPTPKKANPETMPYKISDRSYTSEGTERGSKTKLFSSLPLSENKQVISLIGFYVN